MYKIVKILIFHARVHGQGLKRTLKLHSMVAMHKNKLASVDVEFEI